MTIINKHFKMFTNIAENMKIAQISYIKCRSNINRIIMFT